MPDQRPPQPEDYWRLKHITEMRRSPDGAYLAYVVERSEREENERHSDIWLLDTHSGMALRFTSGSARDYAPRWSPDGAQIAFLSTRESANPQVWVIAVDGGEARRLTDMRRGASEVFWAADGSWVGFCGEVRPDESPTERPPEDPLTRERRERDEAERPRIFTRQVYRWEGRGYLQGRSKLFRVSLADGEVEPLTDGDYDDGEPTCSPDGRWLAFVSDRSEHRDANMSTDLWLLDLETRASRRLTDEHSVVIRPAWSPDGSRLAYLAAEEVGAHSISKTRLVLTSIAEGRSIDRFAGADLSAEVQLTSDLPTPSTSAPVWDANGQAVFCLSQRGGGVAVLRVPVEDGEVESIRWEEDATIKQIALAADEPRFFALRGDSTRTWDIWSYPLKGDEAPTALTNINREVLAQATLTRPERLRVASFDGQDIEAWLYRPAGRDAAPLVLSIHGGPHGAYGQAFSLLAQVLAGRGYAVLHVNPRGSAGYGEAFLRACDGDWGGGDFRDLMAGVDAALARGGLDEHRMAVMGVSYGGYMTNWMVTQTERFRAAVSIYGIANLLSMFGTADMDSVWAQGDYGWPWERPEFYRERSPLTHVARVRTPMRIIVAEEDYRCPASQGEEWYVWLKRLNQVPTDFVRLPHASHTSYASPRQRIQRMELTLAWIERYCPA